MYRKIAFPFCAILVLQLLSTNSRFLPTAGAFLTAVFRFYAKYGRFQEFLIDCCLGLDKCEIENGLKFHNASLRIVQLPQLVVNLVLVVKKHDLKKK